MSRTLLRHVMRLYLTLAAGILGAVVVIFLVVDFIDRSKAYTGEGWVRAVVELYAMRALTSVQQLGPAALLLGAGAAVSTLRKRGEVTALQALGFGPNALYLPVAALALVACLGLVGFDELVVGRAARRAEEITVQRFNRWGDWRFYHTPKQWFRRGEHIFYLRAGTPEGGFEDVTVLTVRGDFQLGRRLDADRMTPVGGTRWRLDNVTERVLPARGGTRVRTLAQAEYDLGIPASAFRIRPGRPEQMRLSELTSQLEARREVGLATVQFALALHNRFAYPLAGLPAALLAVGLALRPGRKGHLTVAILEGLLVAVVMWGLMVICRTLALGERLSPAAAAWLPVGVLALAAGVLWARRTRGARWWGHLPSPPPAGGARP